MYTLHKTFSYKLNIFHVFYYTVVILLLLSLLYYAFFIFQLRNVCDKSHGDSRYNLDFYIKNTNIK